MKMRIKSARSSNRCSGAPCFAAAGAAKACGGTSRSGLWRATRERTPGVEVFGQEPDYDTSEDPVVRSSAAEIRKKLAQYYQRPGHESEARIELSSGSYVAEFHFSGGVVVPRLPRKRSWAIAIGGAAAIVLIGTVALLLLGWKRSDLDQLWGPPLKAPGTILICMGQPVAFNLRSAPAQDAVQGFGPATPPHGPPQGGIRDGDLVVVRDRYVETVRQALRHPR